ncbi:hypothetical protein M885DRAFT_611713 [Pelagophyceae sp. CCMP2097]|nr:hypothetical protein M885DRAFT_611713 [Pelagophyceae sp. CCMP2097]
MRALTTAMRLLLFAPWLGVCGAVDAESCGLRAGVAQPVQASKCRPHALRVLFVLNPIRAITVGGTKQPLGMHGGWISVVNQALGLNQRGACAMVAVSAWTVPSFEENFPAAAGGGVLLPYADTARSSAQLAAALFPHAPAFDVMVATLFTTIEPIAAILACRPTLQPAYFIQDYEADFDNLTPELYAKAVNSYTKMPGALLFAKTHWLRSKVEEAHNVTVHAIRGSIDLSAFAGAREAHLRMQPSTEALAIGAAAQSASAPPRPLAAFGEARSVRVVAMVRPSTPRRNPLGTLRVLRDLKDLNMPGGATRVIVETFGCSHAELRHLLKSPAVLPHWRLNAAAVLREHRGTLGREGIASLFAGSDVFLDMSKWQAFGRTGLEAMAAGVVPVLPIGSGSEEYATDGFNSRLVNTSRIADAVGAVSAMVLDAGYLERMRSNALDTVKKYDMATASLSTLAVICEALDHNRRASPSPGHRARPSPGHRALPSPDHLASPSPGHRTRPSPCRHDKHLDFAHERIFPGSTARQLRWTDIREQLAHSAY